MMYSGLKVLEELKKMGVTHRDVRPDNITVSKDFEVGRKIRKAQKPSKNIFLTRAICNFR